MSDRYFLDTNIFVYCFDRDDKRKQARAEEMVGKATADHLGIISSQVLQEFLNVATRKFAAPMTGRQARVYLETVLAPLCEVFSSVALYQQALSIQEEARYSFYDSLILAAAIEAKCKIVYSEDLHSGQVLRGLAIINPFAGGKNPPVKSHN